MTVKVLHLSKIHGVDIVLVSYRLCVVSSKQLVFKKIKIKYNSKRIECEKEVDDLLKYSDFSSCFLQPLCRLSQKVQCAKICDDLLVKT